MQNKIPIPQNIPKVPVPKIIKNSNSTISQSSKNYFIKS